MSKLPARRKAPPALKLRESFSDGPTSEERVGFYSEESTMITSLERLKEEAKVEAKVEVKPPATPPPALPPLSPATPVQGGAPQFAPPQFTPPSAPLPPASLPPASLPPVSPVQVEEPEGASPFGALQPPPSGAPVSDLGASFDSPHTPLPPHDPDAATDLIVPSHEALQGALASYDAPAHQAMLSPQQGQAVMVALFNPRGGVGCTSVALNLGGALQRQGRRVVIVDMDLQLATLPSSLQVKLERSLAELVMEASQTEGPLQSALDQHHSGLTIIAQEERISEISMVTPDRLPRFFEALRAGFDVVLIDGLRNFSDLAVSVMDEADVVTMVLTQDIPAVRSARKALKLFQRLGYDNAKGRVVLNRFHKRAMISDAVIEDHLGVMLTSRLPNDFKFVSRALAEGELLHVLNPKHPFTLAIDELAAQLVGYELQVKRGGGLLNKLTSMIKRS